MIEHVRVCPGGGREALPAGPGRAVDPTLHSRWCDSWAYVCFGPAGQGLQASTALWRPSLWFSALLPATEANPFPLRFSRYLLQSCARAHEGVSKEHPPLFGASAVVTALVTGRGIGRRFSSRQVAGPRPRRSRLSRPSRDLRGFCSRSISSGRSGALGTTVDNECGFGPSLLVLDAGCGNRARGLLAVCVLLSPSSVSQSALPSSSTQTCSPSRLPVCFC